MNAIAEPTLRFVARMQAVTEPPRYSQPEDRQLESRQLLQGQCEVLIRHGNEVYRLRHTRNDKLILTK